MDQNDLVSIREMSSITAINQSLPSTSRSDGRTEILEEFNTSTFQGRAGSLTALQSLPSSLLLWAWGENRLHDTIVWPQTNTNISVDAGTAPRQWDVPAINHRDKWMGAPLSGRAGGRRQAMLILNGSSRLRLLLFFFFFFSSTIAAAPSCCGDHPTKSLRRIIQTQIKKNRATFRVTGRGGRWSSKREGAGTLGSCAVGKRCVYTTQQLVAGLLWTRVANGQEKATEGSAFLVLLNHFVVFQSFSIYPSKKKSL